MSIELLRIAPKLTALTIDTTTPDELAVQLYTDLMAHYHEIRDIRTVDVRTIWRIARDLVVSIDRWAEVWTETTGAERMDIAVHAAWYFVQDAGGLDAVRDLVAGVVDVPLLGGVARWLARRLITESVARRIIRIVLEFAVRSVRDLTD